MKSIVRYFDNEPSYWDWYWTQRFSEPDPQTVKIGKRSLLSSWIDRRSRVLEVGCGSGRYMRFLEQNLECEVSGVDSSPIGIELAKHHLSGTSALGRLRLGDVFTLELPPAHFDVTLGFGLLEHFQGASLRSLIERRKQLTRAGGVMIDMVPNYFGYWGLRRRYYQRIRRNKEYMAEIVAFTEGRLKDLYAGCGLTDISIKGQGFEHLDGWLFRTWGSVPLPGLLARNLYIRGRLPDSHDPGVGLPSRV